MQRIAGRRIQVGTNGGNTDNVILPPDAGADQKSSLSGQVFKDLAKRGLETDRHEAGRLLQECVEIICGKRTAAELSQQRLLAKAILKLVGWLDLRRNDIRSSRDIVGVVDHHSPLLSSNA